MLNMLGFTHYYNEFHPPCGSLERDQQPPNRLFEHWVQSQRSCHRYAMSRQHHIAVPHSWVGYDNSSCFAHTMTHLSACSPVNTREWFNDLIRYMWLFDALITVLMAGSKTNQGRGFRVHKYVRQNSCPVHVWRFHDCSTKSYTTI